MLNKSLVDGFNVDKTTSKPDCRACIESKGSEEPFQKQSERKTVPGELTHIDLWGKYSIVSINRHQYYSEQQNRSSVGHFHKDCFVVLETLGLNL